MLMFDCEQERLVTFSFPFIEILLPWANFPSKFDKPSCNLILNANKTIISGGEM